MLSRVNAAAIRAPLRLLMHVTLEFFSKLLLRSRFWGMLLQSTLAKSKSI